MNGRQISHTIGERIKHTKLVMMASIIKLKMLSMTISIIKDTKI